MHRLYSKRNYLAYLLLVFSMVPVFVPIFKYLHPIFLSVFFLSYLFGLTLISDYIGERIGGRSILKMIFSKKRTITNYFIVGLVGGFILELYMAYIGSFWWYPYFPVWFYFFLAVGLLGFGIYFLSIVSTYYAAKVVLDKLTKGKKVVTKYYKFEKYLYLILLALGVTGISYSLWKILTGTGFFKDFYFTISEPKVSYITFGTVLITFISFWALMEYVEFSKKRSSFIKDTLHGYFNPLAAVFLASFPTLFYMEIQNLPISLWIYSYEPFGGLTLFHLPLWIYLGWPVHYIGFISLYRAYGEDGPSSEFLKGDSIE